LSYTPKAKQDPHFIQKWFGNPENLSVFKKPPPYPPPQAGEGP